MSSNNCNNEQAQPAAVVSGKQTLTCHSITIVTHSADGKVTTISHVRQFPESFITALPRRHQASR